MISNIQPGSIVLYNLSSNSCVAMCGESQGLSEVIYGKESYTSVMSLINGNTLDKLIGLPRGIVYTSSLLLLPLNDVRLLIAKEYLKELNNTNLDAVPVELRKYVRMYATISPDLTHRMRGIIGWAL